MHERYIKLRGRSGQGDASVSWQVFWSRWDIHWALNNTLFGEGRGLDIPVRWGDYAYFLAALGEQNREVGGRLQKSEKNRSLQREDTGRFRHDGHFFVMPFPIQENNIQGEDRHLKKQNKQANQLQGSTHTTRNFVTGTFCSQAGRFAYRPRGCLARPLHT